MFTVKNVAFSLGVVVLIGMIECRPEAPPPKPKKIVITDVTYEVNKDLMTMKVSLRDGTEGIPVVDMDAELFEDIPGDLYVNSEFPNENLMNIFGRFKLNSASFAKQKRTLFIEHVNNVISRKTVNEYKPLLRTGIKNLCEFLKSPEKEPILKMLLTKLKDFGNLEFHCPMPKGTFHMEGFFIDGQSLPQVAPTGDYKLELAITRKIDGKQTPVFSMVWFATLALKDA